MKIMELLSPITELKNQQGHYPTPGPKIASSYDTIDFGNWTLKLTKEKRITPQTGGTPMFVAMAIHKRQPTAKYIVGLGATQQEAELDVKSKIQSLSKGADINLYQSFTVDLNANFANEYLGKGGGYFRFATHTGTPVLIMSPANHYADYKDLMDNKGFRKADVRTKSQEDGGNLFAFPASKQDIQNNNLIPGGRYAATPTGTDRDGNEVFSLVYDSTTKGSSDKYRLGTPGLTVAGNMKKI